MISIKSLYLCVYSYDGCMTTALKADESPSQTRNRTENSSSPRRTGGPYINVRIEPARRGLSSTTYCSDPVCKLQFWGSRSSSTQSGATLLSQLKYAAVRRSLQSLRRSPAQRREWQRLPKPRHRILRSSSREHSSSRLLRPGPARRSFHPAPPNIATVRSIVQKAPSVPTA